MKSTTRRFNLGDMMILVVAIAVILMSLRELWSGFELDKKTFFHAVTPSRLLAAAWLSAIAVPLTVAALVFRVRRPRPSWRRVALLPGTVVLIVVSVIFATQAVEVVASLLQFKLFRMGSYTGPAVSAIRFGESISLVVTRDRSTNGMIGHIEPIGCFGVMTTSLATPCGPAVAAAWTVLAVSGRWRPERSWIDRLGRVLGWSWILISLLAMFPVKY